MSTALERLGLSREQVLRMTGQPVPAVSPQGCVQTPAVVEVQGSNAPVKRVQERAYGTLRQAVIHAVRRLGAGTAKDIGRICGVDASAAYRVLRGLACQGLVECADKALPVAGRGPRTLWSITEAGKDDGNPSVHSGRAALAARRKPSPGLRPVRAGTFRAQVIAEMAGHQWMSAAELAPRLDVDSNLISAVCQQLCADGRMTKVWNQGRLLYRLR